MQIGKTGTAKTTGPCSPAVSGSGNRFTIKCQGIGKEQGEQFLKILNKIATTQLDPKIVMQKLDEIQRSMQVIEQQTSPYAPKITYDFNGVKHVQNGYRFEAFAGPECDVFRKMVELDKAHDWTALASLCEEQITKTPLWLTPYLFSGWALDKLGQKERAIERLRYVEKMAAGDEHYSAATKILRALQDK